MENNIEGYQFIGSRRFDGFIEFEKNGKHYSIIIKKKGLAEKEIDLITGTLMLKVLK